MIRLGKSLEIRRCAKCWINCNPCIVGNKSALCASCASKSRNSEVQRLYTIYSTQKQKEITSLKNILEVSLDVLLDGRGMNAKQLGNILGMDEEEALENLDVLADKGRIAKLRTKYWHPVMWLKKENIDFTPDTLSTRLKENGFVVSKSAVKDALIAFKEDAKCS